MRARGFIVVAALAGLVYAFAECTQHPRLAGLAGAFALAALAAYAYVSRRPWPVTAAAGALTVAILLPVVWYERPDEYRWTSYGPPLLPDEMSDEQQAVVREATEVALVRFRWMSLAILVAAVLLAVAVARLKRERSGRIMIATAAVAVLLLGVEAYTIWDISDGGIGQPLWWAWPALLASVVFLGSAIWSADAVGAVGGTLLGTWALAFADDVARHVPAYEGYANGGEAFLAPGLQYSVNTSWSLADPWAATYAVVLLLGAGLLAVAGPLREPAVDRVAG
jgi:hypothetical protein